ncbi:MAG: hypothetical protein HOP10_02225 [Chitinophagaceae bacterium]|nr:hypothetical protein [Chitinophagaceae bacterium]
MRGEVLKIMFREDMAFLTNEVALNFTQVEVEIAGKPVEKFKAPAFWTIRVINFIPQEKKIFVEVLNYQVGETVFPTSQMALTDTLIKIEKVTFKSIDTGGLLGTVNGTLTRIKLPTRAEPVYRPERPVYQETKVTREPLKQNYTEPFTIPIKDVKFLDGKVRFEKKIQLFKKLVQFEIQNAHIIQAYDAIKNYFAKVLKTKNIQVVPAIYAVDGETVSIAATSIEIDKIDDTLIEEVKFEIVNTARKKEMIGEQPLLTINEFLETLTNEGVKGQQLFKDEADFFDNLLERSGTKHHTHLRFLSSKHLHNLTKLRLVPKPLSFIFLLAGKNQYHVIWETLDTTEATYIWNFDKHKDLKWILKHVHKTIKQILNEGKNAYLDRKEDNFTRVFHDYTDLQNGFRKWKEEIEEVIS